MTPGILITIVFIIMLIGGVVLYVFSQKESSLQKAPEKEEVTDKKAVENTDHSFLWKTTREDKIFAMLSYLGPLFLIPWLIKKNNEFCMFHAKQGKAIFIAEIVLYILGFIPPLASTLRFALILLFLIVVILGTINVWHEKNQRLPGLDLVSKK